MADFGEEARRRRKIDPIYAAIDSLNWKGALKLCEKKDVRDWLLVKALRGHALERLGRSDEAYALLSEVKERHPTDNATLSALTCTLNLQGKRDESSECYCNALAADPSNLELAQEVHFGYAKNFNFQKQQQLALKMYKQVPNAQHFVFWAATAMLLQASQGGPTQMLTLGERMVKRAIDAKVSNGAKKPSAEELRLYVALLRAQGKNAEALAAVVAHGEGEVPRTAAVAAMAAGGAAAGSGHRIVDETTLEETGVPSEFLMMRPSERLELEGELRLQLQDWAAAEVLFAALMVQTPDQWDYHIKWLDAIFALAAGGGGGPGDDGSTPTNTGQPALLMTARRVCREMQAKHPLCRGPYLAELELLQRFCAFESARGGGGGGGGGGVAADGPGTIDLPTAWKLERGDAPSSSSSPEEGNSVQGAICAVVAAYVHRFGSKVCCAMDLQPYLCGTHRTGGATDDQLLERLSAMFADTRSTSQQALAAAAAAAEAAEAAAKAAETTADAAGTGAAAGDGAGDGAGDEEGDVAAPDPAQEARRAQRTKQLRTHITCCQCRRLLGAHALPSHRDDADADADAAAAAAASAASAALRAEVRLLVDEYQATLDVNEGATGGQREVQHGDELLLLAVHMLRDLWEFEGGRHCSGGGGSVYSCQLDALLLLEFGRSKSPHNYHFKLELMRLYQGLGGFAGGIAIYNELDVKHIQLDSLSWLLFPGLYSSGFFEEAGAQCRAIMRLHKRTAADSGEFITKAYTNGNYSKAIEITQFQQQRMERSMQLALARGDYVNIELQVTRHEADDVLQYLQQVTEGEKDESPKQFDSEDDIGRLSVNHDWGVRVSWNPSQQPPGDDAAAAADAPTVGDKSTDNYSTNAVRHGMVRRIKLHMLVPRVLLACLQGATDELAEHFAALQRVVAMGATTNTEAAEEAAAGGGAGAGGGGGTTVMSIEELSTSLAALAISPANPSSVAEFEEYCLAQAVHMFEAHLAVNRFKAAAADGGGGDDDDQQDDDAASSKKLAGLAKHAAGLIQTLAGSVRASTALLSGSAAAHSVSEGCPNDAATGDGRKPLSAPWLACLSKFMESSGLWLIIVVQSLVKAMPTTEKKKKSKGKKNKKTTAADSEIKSEIAGTTDLVDAVRALLKAAIEVFSSIRSIFRARTISAEAFAATYVSSTSHFPEFASAAFEGVRSEVAKTLADSQTKSIDNRLQPLLNAKLGVLQSLSL